MTPELSIIIPMRNAGDRIGALLDSIACQENINMEIIVVDDASTDNSVVITQAWSSEHPLIQLKLLRQNPQGYALAARLAGFHASSAPEIMFADADDSLMGKHRLARVLAQKNSFSAELAHFRSQMIEPDGKLIGDVHFNRPLSIGLLEGRQILDAYTSLSWPPGEIWGKIYSRGLLDRVIPFLPEKPIQALDTHLWVLALFAAKSYLGCREIIYEYKICPSLNITRYAKRLGDLPPNMQSLMHLCKKLGIPLQYMRAYRDNFFDGFIAWNAGKICEEMENLLASGTKMDNLLASVEKHVDLDHLLAETLFSTQRNAAKIKNCQQRITNEF